MARCFWVGSLPSDLLLTLAFPLYTDKVRQAKNLVQLIRAPVGQAKRVRQAVAEAVQHYPFVLDYDLVFWVTDCANLFWSVSTAVEILMSIFFFDRNRDTENAARAHTVYMRDHMARRVCIHCHPYLALCRASPYLDPNCEPFHVEVVSSVRNDRGYDAEDMPWLTTRRGPAEWRD